MSADELLILSGGDVAALLAGRERQVIEAVRAAYVAHGNGASALPHSSFLRFPGAPRNRIIALPAYLGEDFRVAGIKWIASFPGNLARGRDRASAVIILNSPETGEPQAIIEGSLISARRTAASAALAASRLHEGGETRLGLIGGGLIAFEIVRFMRTAMPQVSGLVVHDSDARRAALFRDDCAEAFPGLAVEVVDAADRVLAATSLVAFATTATEPYLGDLSACPPRSTLLHVSLRDLTAGAILASDNVVDDVDHVCRAQTSVHLAEQQVGHRDFIRCTLADVLSGRAPARPDDGRPTIFSPFGLGVLDMAVAQMVYSRAQAAGVGRVIENFLPASRNRSAWSAPREEARRS